MSNDIDSINHVNEKRPLIPSQEEAGQEPKRDGQCHEYPRNPVIERGQDPELFWMHKYGADDAQTTTTVDIRALYRTEHIDPELALQSLYRWQETPLPQGNLFDVADTFGAGLKLDEFDKVGEYYNHQEPWTNRLIQGDSLLVMTSLLNCESMAGKVQMIYLDPPYGIKYGSNWQIQLNSRNVKDGDDAALSNEPEQIKAFRDTWELGIHTYLSYLRDRLLVARELLNESGSCFVQISDENVHLVRCVMDEVFGSGNFVAQISVTKTAGQTDALLPSISDLVIWYSKAKELVKFRKIYMEKSVGFDAIGQYYYAEFPDGIRRRLTNDEINNPNLLEKGTKPFRIGDLTSNKFYSLGKERFEYHGKHYLPSAGRYWTHSPSGREQLRIKNRLFAVGNSIRFVGFLDDFPYAEISNRWDDTGVSGFGANKLYVVQTNPKIIQRCLLMTTDPGDLVLDPTCGSGTTAYVAEQWGRRWITIDTSRIAMSIAKTRLLTATYPYYQLHDTEHGDIRHGFIYKTVPHITLKSLANDEPPATETLYDQPLIDKKRLRVSGPFTVETLQQHEPLSPADLARETSDSDRRARFESLIFAHLQTAGIKNGARNETAVFTRVDPLSTPALHAEGYYPSAHGERKAYFHIGPQFGAVSKNAVSEAIKECRACGDADWLVILGFAFEGDVPNHQSFTQTIGRFEVTKTRIHDDLLQEGLLKKDKKAASFVTIGEPDMALHRDGDNVTVEICGLDIYNPIQDQVNPRNREDLAYWLLDDDYDGSNFIARQFFFCGGDGDEFDSWHKGLRDLANSKAKRKQEAEKTLRIEIDEEAFERLYGFVSHPIPYQPGRKLAVRVISQFGEECTKVLSMD
jgi:adenine-specific DNA-methyltransferase